MDNAKYTKWLCWAFIAGAIVDGLAVIPLLVPSFAQFSFGVENLEPMSLHALRLEANSLFCWTILLLWALRSPIERAFIAPLTLLAIFGLIAAEILAVMSAIVPLEKTISTWVIQAILLVLYVPVSIEYFSRRKKGVP